MSPIQPAPNPPPAEAMPCFTCRHFGHWNPTKGFQWCALGKAAQQDCADWQAQGPAAPVPDPA